MAEPTLEELQKEVDELKKLVVPHFDPPSGNEMSFPVERQGITQTQFQQMNLPNGDGVIVTDDGENSHLLTGHETDSITNERNTLILRVSANTGRAEAVIAGFYHVLNEDVELEFPAVSSTTTYYVCITYDPRKFRDPSGPVFLKVYDDTPPETDGRKHLILHTVTRRPNELLTRAQRNLYRQMITPVITVSRGEEGLPESTQVPYSTLAIDRPGTSGGNVVPGTGQIYEARGIHGWHNLLIGEWQSIHMFGGWRSTFAFWRHRLGGIDVIAHFTKDSNSSANSSRPARIPSSLMARNFRSTAHSSRNYGQLGVLVNTLGEIRILSGGVEAEIEGGWVAIDLFIPDYFLNS